MVWDTDTTYPIDGIVNGSNGDLYICISEQSGNDPTTDNGDNWSFYLSTKNTRYANDVATLKTLPLKEGTLAGTLGYYGNNGIGASLGIIKTAAQASSDGDIVDEFGNITLDNGKVYILIDSGVISVEQFGVATGMSDTGPQHNAAAAHCVSTNKALTSNAGVIYLSEETVNFRSIRFIDYKAQLTTSNSTVAMLLGGDANDTGQFYVQKVHKVNRGTGTSIGVRLVGSNKNYIYVGETSIFEIYADTMLSLGGTDSYSAYNRINVQSCTTFQINSNASTDGSVVQWINENQIYLQFCLYFKAFDNGYQHNGNQFWGGNFEAVDSTIEWETGIGNTMRNVRGESALAVIFGANAHNNTVLTDWFGSANNPAAGASVTSFGLNNCVKNINDINNDRVTIMSCNGTSLKDDGGGNSNLLGMNSGLTKDAVNNTITASANQQIFQSQLIEVNPSDEYFDVEVTPKLSGGIKMQIDGWDSNMNSISSTGDDVFFQGATNENAGFGENSTTITNSGAQRRIHIKNSTAKYIKLTVSASSAGCSFRRFTVEAVTSNKNGKKQMLASAMIPNV